MSWSALLSEPHYIPPRNEIKIGILTSLAYMWGTMVHVFFICVNLMYRFALSIEVNGYMENGHLSAQFRLAAQSE